MTIKIGFLLLFTLLSTLVVAQQDTISKIRTVFIADNTLKKFANAQRITTINDSMIAKNQPSLTSLLNFNSSIYFKENGLGMVSSPSFRGTTAQQTAVIWNGININSQLNGQTDFNLITTTNFNSINIRSGGGSVIYGSSAIGGSIHLNNEFQFINLVQSNLQFSAGSFSTMGLNYKLKVATSKFASDFSFFRSSSANNYPYLNTTLINQNGAFHNSSFNFNVALKVNNFNQIKLYSQIANSNRDLSGTLTVNTKSNYIDFNLRTMMEWVSVQNKFTSTTKLAYLQENYRYYEDKNDDIYSDGKASNAIFRYDFSYKPTSKIIISTIADFTKTVGSGSSIAQNQRSVLSNILLFKHQVFNKLSYEVGVRKETNATYLSPLLYSFGINFIPVAFYALRVNGSKNFRIPTFNDLYWQGQGNANLQPETSHQAEIGNDFFYKGFSLSTTVFFIDIDNMIQWVPNAAGSWAPNNVKKVQSTGVETALGFEKKYKNHTLILNANYAFTASQDKVLQKQNIYVPFHKAAASGAYYFKNMGFTYQFLYNGKVFTSSDNEFFLKSYKISNLALNYSIGHKQFAKITFQINNIFNQNYQNVAVRPMPGRNYNFILNLKF